MADTTRRLLGWESSDEGDPLDICPSLTYKQRIIGFSVSDIRPVVLWATEVFLLICSDILVYVRMVVIMLCCRY